MKNERATDCPSRGRQSRVWSAADPDAQPQQARHHAVKPWL